MKKLFILSVCSFFVKFNLAQNKLTEEDKKIFAKNLTTILNAAPKFGDIQSKKIINYYDHNEAVATISLFPQWLFDNNRNVIEINYSLTFTQIKENYYYEFTKAPVTDVIHLVEQELAKKNFEELEPIYNTKDFVIKVYRLKDVIICINKATEAYDATSIRIGRIPYYNNDKVVVKRKLSEKNNTVSNTTAQTSTKKTDTKDSNPQSKYAFAKKNKYGRYVEGNPIAGDSIFEGNVKFDTLNEMVFEGKFKYKLTSWGDDVKMLNGSLFLNNWKVKFTGVFLEKIGYDSKWASGTIYYKNDKEEGELYNTSNYNSAYYFIPTNKNRRKITLYNKYNTNSPEVVYNEKTEAEEETYAKEIEERRKRNQAGGSTTTTSKTSTTQKRKQVDEETAKKIKYDADELEKNLREWQSSASRFAKDCEKARMIPGFGRNAKSCTNYYNYNKYSYEACDRFLKKYKDYLDDSIINQLHSAMQVYARNMDSAR